MSKIRLEDLEEINTGLTVSVSNLINIDQKTTNDAAITERIAVVGDSLSARNALYESCWPEELGDIIRGSGKNAEIFNFSINSVSPYRFLTENFFGNKNVFQMVEECNPTIVIVALGMNDAVYNSDNRTQTQINQDLSDLFSALRLSAPNAILVHCNVLGFDENHADPDALLNRNVIPANWQLASSGPLQDMITKEVAGDSISTEFQDGWDRWRALRTYAATEGVADFTIEMNYWRISRLGLLGTDLLHPTTLAHSFQAAYVLKGLINQAVKPTFFGELAEKQYETWEDPDLYFDSSLSWNGTDYNYSPGGAAGHVPRIGGDNTKIFPETWMYRFKASMLLPDAVPVSNVNGANRWLVYFSISNAKPLTDLYSSVGGGAFSDLQFTTDEQGNGVKMATLGPTPSGELYRYRVGDEVYGPFALGAGF